MQNSFKEEDKDKLVELLNFIATKATFPEWKTEDTIKHFKLLAYIQQTLLPKITSHILEVRKISEPEAEPKAKPVKKSKN